MTVRPTGILVEDNRILLVRQKVTETRGWSLPGGHLEPPETIKQCMVRELKEETGLDVVVGELLYVVDRFQNNAHVVHITFLINRISELPSLTWRHTDLHSSKTSDTVREIRMVPIDELTQYGFPGKFVNLVKAGFPGRGSYQGNFSDFYGGL